MGKWLRFLRSSRLDLADQLDAVISELRELRNVVIRIEERELLVEEAVSRIEAESVRLAAIASDLLKLEKSLDRKSEEINAVGKTVKEMTELSRVRSPLDRYADQ